MRFRLPKIVSAFWSLCAMSITVLLLAACGTTPDRSAFECPKPDAQHANYVIGPGDILNIFVWRNPELSGTIPVRPDGKISISLVEDMVAVGKTPSELARDMEAILGEFLRIPKVNIILQSEGASNQIQVLGNVIAPQAVAHRENFRVLDAIVAVGGLDPFAAGNRAQLIRQVDGQTIECRVRIADLVSGEDMSQNIDLYPGDVIIVPQSRF